MRTRYLVFFLIFIVIGAVFTFFRTPIADGINTLLIAIGEGRSIRVDNTDMVKRKTEKQVKVKGAARISNAAQIRVLKEKISAPPVNQLSEGKVSRKRRVMFVPDWAVLGPFDQNVIAKKFSRDTVLAQECMNQEAGGVSFQMVPKGFQWRQIQSLSNDGRINLTEVFKKNRSAAAAWLVTEIEVDRDYPDARMLVGIQQFGRVFLNGRQVFVSTAKTPSRADGSNIPVKLEKGRNRIIVKTASSNFRTWHVFLRFTTAKKVPLMPPLPEGKPATASNKKVPPSQKGKTVK